ncbi:MAG TPA: hypothetical protein VK249_13835 [Anaerolineales bacterium]|nr:hypothetical protein [Anaerolineales bacterium]
MTERNLTMWPFKPRTAIILSISILLFSLILLAIFKSMLAWPAPDSEKIVLLGVFIISLLPVVLMLADTLIERGAVVEYKGVRIDFSQVQRTTTTGITIPANIGVTGQAVNDSGATQILDALRQAVSTNIVIVDLEDGHAWWETRLLVLLSGAVRHNQPKTIVFVATDSGTRNCYQGWGSAGELLPLLLNAHPKYRVIYDSVLAAAQQWAMLGPHAANTIPAQPTSITQPGWDATSLATNYLGTAFDYNTGLLTKFSTEQVLASELYTKIEQQEAPRTISIVRLQELFRAVLHISMIDETWPSERQLSEFFRNDLPYMAMTENGQFKSLIARSSVLNAMVGTLVQGK